MSISKSKLLFTNQGVCDRKHVLNTCTKIVPQEMLDAIETGCSLETIDEFIRQGYDIYKYQTQITIHGLFPELANRRVGGYVNLTQNLNGSIGVRWSAIDGEKKSSLFDTIKKVSIWNRSTSSTKDVLYIQRRCDDNVESVIAEMREIAAKIDTSLFYGGVSIYRGYCYGVIFVIIEIQINAFYGKNRNAILENITGLTIEEIDLKLAKIEAERAARAAEYERQREAERAIEKQIAEQKELLKSQIGLPDGFERVDNYRPKRGDKIALYRFNTNDPDNVRFEGFAIYIVYWVGSDSAKAYPIEHEGDKSWARTMMFGKCRIVKTAQSKSMPKPKPEIANSDVKVIDYSERAIAVIGDTRTYASRFKELHGKFNPRLKCGAGWIFSKRYETEVKKIIK